MLSNQENEPSPSETSGDILSGGIPWRGVPIQENFPAQIWLNSVRQNQRGIIFASKGCKQNGDLETRELIFTDHDAAINSMRHLVDDGFNIFVSIGNLQAGATNRKAASIESLSSLFIDLDVGPDKDYSSQMEAVKALAVFIKDSDFPRPSLLIDSGGGIHAYWCLDNPLPVSEWRALAGKFKKYLIAAGLHIDPVVTADCARVMRVPGTFNNKLEDNPRPVTIMYPQNQGTVKRYSVHEIKGIVGFQHQATINHPTIEKNLTQNLMGNDASARLIALSCKQVETILNDGGATRSEPEWRADLGLMKFTIEAPGILHDVSKSHLGYSFSETEEKAEKWTASPTTCLHYYEHLSSPICHGCQYKGRITSPIQLGYPTPRGVRESLTFDSNNQKQKVLASITPATPAVLAKPPAYLGAPSELLQVSQQFAWDRDAMNIYNLKTGRYVQKDRFMTHNANRFIDLGTAQKPKPVPLGQAWIQHPLRREATCIRMAPNEPEDLPDGAINSWLGFNVEPVPGDIKPFIKLFKRQIPNAKDRRYVLHWIANLFQNPATKTFTSIVMWSRIQGTGKNLIWECIGNLFNERHFTLVGQEVFDDAFTDWKANRVFVICDEVSSTEKRATADRIKGWITSSSNSINTKNEPKFSQPNLIKYVFLSNHPDAVFLDDNDRRFFVVEVTQGRLSEQEATQFANWRDNGGRAALLHFLLNLNIKEFNPKAPAPMSSAKQEMIDDNKSDLERWLDNIINNIQATIGREICSAEELSEKYSSKTNHRCSSKTVGTQLKKYGAKRITKQAKLANGKRLRVYSLTNHHIYENKTDKELGDIFAARLHWSD